MATKITPEQKASLRRLFVRAKYRGELENNLPTAQGVTYLQFRRLFRAVLVNDPCLFGGPWMGMYFGIETDGYTHT
jgi:hypothetical protein